MAASSVRVAIAQMTSINDLASNFATCSCITKETAPVGVKLICFLKNFAFVGAKDGYSLSVAKPLDGPIMQQYCSLARETGIWLSLGGFQEKGLDDKHLCNTLVVIDDAGKIKSTYKKIHFLLKFLSLNFKMSSKSSGHLLFVGVLFEDWGVYFYTFIFLLALDIYFSILKLVKLYSLVLRKILTNLGNQLSNAFKRRTTSYHLKGVDYFGCKCI
ncbi:hypothetical protein UlMin_020354 [Ulmus minor]